MKLLTVDTIEEAREKLRDCARFLELGVEHTDISGALGRVVAEDIRADCDIPAFRRSTVDGYAVIAGDTGGAGEALPVFLTLAGSVNIGTAASFSLGPGRCAYVPTGAMLPHGADAMVMVEYSEIFGQNVAIYEAAASGSNMAQVGEDLRRGEVLFRRGVTIRPQEAGALAAAGIVRLPVYRPLDLTIISTGDELVPPDKIPRPGEIRDINTTTLKALATRSGYRVVFANAMPDDEALLEKVLRKAMAESDVVLVSGGSSQGEKDITAALISQVASPGVFTHGLALKPGKPTILGYDRETKTILGGLPGHPVSAMMAFELLFSWLSAALSGRAPAFPVPARVSCNIPASPGKTTCQPVTLCRENNSYTAEPVFGKSGMISTLTRSDGYIIIDKNKEGLKKDEVVMVFLF
jgi:molybdopterin molybdotransferase